jgi:gliding motility-associated-like protein
MKKNYFLNTKSNIRKAMASIRIILIAAILIVSAGFYNNSFAGVTITAPSLTITACSFPSSSFMLGDVVIAEGAVGDISGSGTILLTAPANFEFTFGGNASVTGTEITGVLTTSTNSTITLAFDVSGTVELNTITISGIFVRGVNSPSGPSNVTRTGGSGIVSGDVNGTVHATLTSVLNAVTGGTIGSAQTICSGGDPANLTQIVAATGTALTYQWLSGTDGTTFPNNLGTAASYDPPSGLTLSTYYRLVTTSTLNGVACTANSSNDLIVTVDPVISNNTISTAQTICSGSTPNSLSGSTPTGGSGSYTYVWESSVTSSSIGFSSTGVTSINFTPGSLSANTWYRRVLTSGPCTDISTSIGITITTPIAGNTVSAAQTICSGTTPVALTGSTPTGGTGAYTYLWESSVTSSTSGFSSTGVTSIGYSPSFLAATTWYRRVVTSSPCTDVSSAVTITVTPVIASNTVSASQTICSGSTPNALTGSTPTGGTGVYTYVWESSVTNSSSGFSSTGVTTINYTPGALVANTWYRRTVTSGPCTDVSSAIGITITPVITGNSINAAQTICSGTTPSSLTGSTPSGGTGSYTYSWESSTTSSTAGFSSTGVTTINYTPGSLVTNTWYRRNATSGACTDVTPVIGITVTSAIAGNTVSAAQTICSGSAPNPLTGSTPTGGTGSYNYLWEFSTTSSTTGFSSTGGISIGYSPGSLSATTWYRRTVTSGICTDVSAAIKMTITPVIATDTISAAQTICSGTTPNSLVGSTPTGGTGSYTYLWESSTTSSIAGFSSTGVTTIGYSSSSLTNTTWFRRTATSGPCTDVSPAIAITVNPVINSNTIGSAQTICSGTTPSPLTGSTPGGGNGSYTYLWESSTTSSSVGFSSTGVTTIGYSPGSLAVNTWYRRTVASGFCTDVTPAIQITITPVIAGNTISTAQTLCSGATPNPLTGSTPTGGIGSYTYVWESSTTSSSAGFSATGGTSTGFAPGSLVTNTWYRRTVTSGTCTNVSTPLKITVNPVIAGNTVSAAQTICSGTAPGSFTGSTPSGGNGSYTYLWDSSTVSGNSGFASTNGTSINYTTSSLTTNTWYRRTVTSSTCSDVSSAIAITVTPVIAGNSINAAQTICSGSVPTPLTGGTPTGGSGSYTYSWESSTTSSTTGFSSTGGTAIGYAPGTLAVTTWYRRVVTSSPCTDISSAIKITVTPAIAGNTINAAQTVCSGSTASPLTGSTPTGGTGSYTYLWESSTTSSSTGFSSTGGTAIGFAPGIVSTTTWYRRTVTSGTCTDVSPTITITVDPVIASNIISSVQTICSGATPSALTGSTPTGGNGSYAYLWEFSTTSSIAGFSSTGGTSIGFSPGVLSVNTWYRRTVTSSSCTDVSAAIAITVSPVIASNTVSSAQTICSGSAPNPLTGSTPTGGVGSYTYVWEFSTTSSTAGFSSTGGTGIGYTPGALAANTWYRRVITSGTCTDVSIAIPITINPVIAGNTISAAQTICSGSAPSPLTGSTPTGGNGSYTYLWESSTTSSSTGFSSTGGTSIGYSPSVIVTNTWYRRTTTSGSCTDVSPAIAITVTPAIASNTISTAQTICSGAVPNPLTGSTPTGGTGSYTYSWESSITSNIAGFSPTGITTIGFSPGVLATNTWYRRVVTSGVCGDVSLAVGITITPVIASNTVGTAQTICSGSTPNPLTGSTPTGGGGSYVYLWESSITSSTAGFSSTGGTSIGYTSSSLAATTWFRRTVTSGACTDVSSAIAITVTPVIASNTVSAAQTICSGSTPSPLTGSTPTGGSGSYTYSWEFSITSSTAGFSSTGGTSIGYSPGILATSTWYRRIVTSSPCTDVSAAIKITVTPAISSNAISAAQTICSGSTPSALTGSTPTGGTGAYTYSWESSTTSSIAGFSSTGGTSIGFSPGVLATTTWYRRVVTSAPCTDISPVIQITVVPVISSNLINAAQTICSGVTPNALTGTTPTGGSGSYTYVWESSVTSSTIGFSSTGGTGVGYAPGSLTQTTWYRRIVTSDACTDLTPAITITVNPVIVGNSVSAAQTICGGATPSPLTGSTPTGGTGSYTYFWESSTTSSTNGFAAAGGTSIGFTPGALATNTWYRRTVTSGACTDVSAAIGITVNTAIGNNTISAAQSICSGSTPNPLIGSTPTGGVGGYTYLWESSVTSSTTGFSAATGTNNGINYTPGSLAATTWYRRTVTSCISLTDVLSAIAISVNVPIGNNIASAAQTICSGTTPVALSGTAPTGGNASYTYLWESSVTSSNAGFTAASGVNTNIGYIPASLTLNTWYKRVASSCATYDTSAAIKITINPLPVAIGSNNAQTICSGVSSTIMTLSTSNGVVGTTFAWTRNNGNISSGNVTGIAAAGTGDIPSATLVNTTTSPVTVTFTITPTGPSPTFCVGSSITTIIVVNPIPVLNSGNTPPSICNGANFVYNATSATLGASFTWSRAAAANILPSTSSGIGNVNEALTNNSGVAPINVTYVYITSANGCSNSPGENVIVAVNPTATLNSSLAPSSFCSGTAFSYNPTSPALGAAFAWSRAVTANITNALGSGTDNPNELLNSTSTAAVSVTYVYSLSVNGCPNPSTYNVVATVNPIPTLNSSLLAPAMCSGTPFSYAPTSITTGTSFSWTRAAVVGVSNIAASGTGNPNEVLINTTTDSVPVTYVYTLSANGCVNPTTYSVVVDVNPSPKLTSTPFPNAICSNNPFNYTPTSQLPGVTFLWTRAAVSGLSNIASSGTGAINESLTLTDTVPVNVTYIFTLSTNDCTNGTTFPVTLTVNRPCLCNHQLTSSFTPPAVCSNTLFSYIPTSSSSGASFAWTRASVLGISNSTASGNGDPSETLINTTSSPVHVVYIYTITANNCTNPNTFSVDITVNPTPVFTSGITPPAICSGTTFYYTPTSSTAGTTFSWLRPAVSGISNSSNIGTDNPNEALTNTTTDSVYVKYIYTLSANGCINPNRDTVVVKVNPTPVLSSSLTANVCSGTVFNYIPSSLTTGTSFLWTRVVAAGIGNSASSGAGNPSETLINISTAQAYATYAYTMSANNCQYNQNVVVTVNPTPTLSSSLTLPAICSGTTFSYTPTSSTSGASFGWTRAIVAGISNAAASGAGNPNEALNNTTSDSVNVIYVYTVSANGCMSGSYNVVVRVLPTPILSSSLTPLAICSGSTFYYTPTSTTVGASFPWTRAAIAGISNPASSGMGDPIETLFNTTTNPISVIYVYQVAANGCLNAITYSVTVSVNPLPTLSSSLSPPALCSGAVFTYNPTSTTAGASFAWNRLAVIGISNGTAVGVDNPNETLINTTSDPVNVTYVYTVSANGCTNPASYNMVVRINPIPALSSSLSPSTICSGTAFGYTPTSLTVGTSFAWTRPFVIGISNATASGVGNFNETLINTSAATVRVTYDYTLSANGCANATIDSVVVFVVPQAVGGVVSSNVTACSSSNNGTLLLHGQTGSVIRWEFSTDGGNAWGIINNNTTSLIYNNVNTTTLYRAVVQTGTCPIKYSANDTITITPKTVGGAISSNASVCSGTNTGTLTLSGSVGNTLNWISSTNNGLTWTAIAGTTGVQSYSYNNLTTTTKYVALVQSGVCPVDSATAVVIKVNPNPVANFTAPPVCAGQTTTFTNGSTISSGSIDLNAWNFGDTTYASTTLPGTVLHKYNSSGTYPVTLVVTSSDGCSTTIAANAIVNALPDAHISHDVLLPICIGNSVVLSAVMVAGTTYLWSPGGATTDHISVNTAGEYTLKVKNGSNCISIDSIAVSVVSSLSANAGSNATVILGNSVMLEGTGTGAVTYSWSPAAGLDNPAVPNPLATPVFTTTYTLTVTDGNSCVDTASITITVVDGYNLIISNVMTPNGDGENDTWNIINIENYPNTQVTVVNNQGQQVYISPAYDNTWDGTFNGKPLPDGTYYYFLKFATGGKVYSGAISIFKNK